MPRDRPNVVCFILDQLRYDHVGCMGNPTIQTPHIDRLADEGVTCERAYGTNPVCTPSRSSMLSGRMPRDAVRFNGAPLDASLSTLPGILRDAGYRTHSVGKLHLHPYSTPTDADPAELDPAKFPECRDLWDGRYIEEFPEPWYGFGSVDYVAGHTDYVSGEYRHWLKDNHPEAVDLDQDGKLTALPPEDLHYNRWIADRSKRFLSEIDDQPFFLWCSFPDPHPPFLVPEPWNEMYEPAEVEIPPRREGELENLPPHHERADATDRELREDIATAYGMTSFVDQEIGRVMEALEAQDRREDTVIIFLSDHGDFMGGHWQTRKGPYHFDDIVRLPLVWSAPGRFPEGRRTDAVVSAVDILPTVLDICDVPFPEPGYEGYVEPGCGLPALPGQSLRPILAGGDEPVRDGAIVESDDYYGIRARTYVTEQYKVTVYPGHSYGELFDLEDDPAELHNRWGDPEYEDVRARLIEELFHAYVGHESCLPRKPGSWA